MQFTHISNLLSLLLGLTLAISVNAQAWQKRIQSRWNNIVQETGIKLEK